MKVAALRALSIILVARAAAYISSFSVDDSGHKVMFFGVVCGTGYCQYNIALKRETRQHSRLVYCLTGQLHTAAFLTKQTLDKKKEY